MRHWRDLSRSAYERDLVTNEKVEFRSLDPNRTFEGFFFSLAFCGLALEAAEELGELVECTAFNITCTLVSLAFPISSDVSIHAKR